jgi:O-acetyl-ADP-ribose deacetylase (regulator of RNase III)
MSLQTPLRAIKQTDITVEPADALIYSTNVLLNCSGGVGSSLLAKYGSHVQTELHTQLSVCGRKFAERGEIFQFVPAGMPYQAVFHTVPCDGWYETTPEIIESILRRCLSACLEMKTIYRITMSALATGYGHLGFEEFLRIANRVFRETHFDFIQSITICVDDESRFHDAARCIHEDNLSLSLL